VSDGFLHRYFLTNAHKPLHKWVHYFDVYERHLARFRGRAPVVVEIGVQGGGSLAMWREYFGPGCRVVGVDIDPTCKAHEGDGIEVVVGGQADPATAAAVLARHPRVDVVIDDGSHRMADQVASFELLYHRLDPAGVYLVEDTHTCYWEEYGGGLGRPGSFMEFVKHKLDELNAVHARGQLPVTEFTRSTACVACYDSVVVFERRPQGQRQAPVTGPMG
jgi:hypothetical protein